MNLSLSYKSVKIKKQPDCQSGRLQGSLHHHHAWHTSSLADSLPPLRKLSTAGAGPWHLNFVNAFMVI